MKKTLTVIFFVVILVAVAFAQTGVKKKRPLPYEYGRVIINNYSEKAGLAPVVFDHWIHRSKITCRVCHVDVGFAMKAGGTDIRAADNMSGYYCGSCHNNRTLIDGKKIFEACSNISSAEEKTRCLRCHSLGKNVKPENDFRTFARRMPKGRFGNGIDWEKAEEEGLVKPIDFVEGVSIERPSLAVQKDFALQPKLEGMPDIIFSHKKHTVWNGCEVCHPEIFIGVQKGSTKYSMIEIFNGKYCGVCHTKVAFPLTDCQRCHSKPVM